MGSVLKFACAGALLCLAQPALAATNVIPGHVVSVSVSGIHGTLRPGSPWGLNSTASSLVAPVDGIFAPNQQQWNNGSFWWDEDPAVTRAKLYYEMQLDHAYTVNRFVVQADDNESYLLEYWDGGGWQTAFAVATLPSFGLVTRDSGLIGSITTDRFRFSATGGDNYYAVSEIQAFAAVPEPATWAMLILGFGLLGGAMRRSPVRRFAPA